jgi:hypothetical protein
MHLGPHAAHIRSRCSTKKNIAGRGMMGVKKKKIQERTPTLSRHTMGELTSINEQTFGARKIAEAAFGAAYADMSDCGRRLDYNWHGPWLNDFHARFGGDVR